MMKSFFKKLAFVMALAMVVSMVAPAGSALAAESGVSLQGTKTIVDSYELDKAGATVDFAFEGCTTWGEYKNTDKWGWTSSNEAVATVNKAGVVTAVAAGTATITIAVGDDYKESVVVTVKGDNTVFEVAQINLTKFNMTFDAEKDVKAADVEVVMMINDVEAPIPVKSVKVNENVATVELFSEFIDGITYNVTYAKETQTFVGSVGEIDHVAFEYWTVQNGDGVAYVSTEEEPTVATLVYKLFDANNVDITDAYDEEDLTIEYEFANESEAYEIMDNEVTFYEPGAAVVNLTVTWTTDDADEIVKPFTGVVVATKRPAIAHTIAEAGFIATNWYDNAAGAQADFTSNKNSFFWSDNAYLNNWKLGDGGNFQFAALIKDNRGNTVVSGINEYGARYAVDRDGNRTYPYGYFKFVTSNDEVVDVDAEGTLTFWGVGSASIITYFVDTTGEEDKEVFVGSTKLTVSPARYPASYAIASNSLTTYTHAADNYSNTVQSYVLTVRDQYGDNIALANGANDITTELKTDSDDILVTSVNADFSADLGCTYNWCGNSQGGIHYHIGFNGSDFANYVGDKDYKTIQYTVAVDKEANEKLAGAASNTVKLIVRNTKAYADAIGVGTATKFYYNAGARWSRTGVDVVVNNMKNFKKTDNNELTKWVGMSLDNLDKNGLKMTQIKKDNVLPLGENQKTGEAGKLYYAVEGPKASYDKNGNLVNWMYGVEADQWDQAEIMIRLNTVDGTNFSGYAATGTYKISVYYVKNNYIGTDGTGNLSLLKTQSYSVTNSQPDPKFAKYDDKLGNKTTEAFGSYDADGNFVKASEADLLDIIKANLDFTYDGGTINWSNADFSISFPQKDGATDPASYTVTAGKLRVNSVVITVKLDDGGAKAHTYSKTVNIGKTIYHVDEE